MSQKLISLSPDLKRLRAEGYEIDIVDSYLVMRHVPYVNATRQVKFGALVSELSLAGDRTARPSTHVIQFAGDGPCDKHGRMLSKIVNDSINQNIGDGLTTTVSMSSKPANGYPDYYEKFTAYASMLWQHAQAIKPGATAKTYVVPASNDNQGVFRYLDTASSRAGISEVTDKLKQGKVAIIGLGGTGAYVLDLVAKTPITEIHIYDDDVFQSHNAFRSPGCSSVSELRKQPYKVTYYRQRYSKLHGAIIPHRVKVTKRNIHKLKDCNFVFICVDNNASRLEIAEVLLGYGVPFVDVGMGLEKANSSLVGIVRTSYCDPTKNENIPKSIPRAVNDDGDDLYSSNIQANELNALNAVMAVIKWKKHCGFYVDLECEGSSIYTLDGNHLLNKGNGE